MSSFSRSMNKVKRHTKKNKMIKNEEKKKIQKQLEKQIKIKNL